MNLKKVIGENETKLQQYSEALKINNEKMHSLTSEIFTLRDNVSN